MKNVIYIIVIFFWILSMISKSKRQKQQAAEREKMRQTNNAPKQPRERSTLQIPEEVRAALQIPEATDYESAYASSDYRAEEKPPDLQQYSEAETPSSFQKNYGMGLTLGTESSEEKQAYDKEEKNIPRLAL